MQTGNDRVPPEVSAKAVKTKSPNSPLEWAKDPLTEEQAMALLALSHTKTEHLLYEQMVLETTRILTRVGAFGIRHLMSQTGLTSYNDVRRAREGLIKKLSIEPQRIAGSFFAGEVPSEVLYFVFQPEEIFERRRNAGLKPYPKQVSGKEPSSIETVEIIRWLTSENNLSRREAQVALKCAEGLSNAEIGETLFIHPETVKFHLRNVYAKFGVKKRTELMVRLLLYTNSG